MENGIRYDSPSKRAIVEVIKQDLESFEVPASVVAIYGGSKRDSAFYQCRGSIKNITFQRGSNVSRLDKYLFSSTTLQSIDMSQCGLLLEINFSLFSRCSYLSNVILPPNVELIKSGSFYSCESLTEINIPDSLLTIEGWESEHSSPFGSCINLKRLVFGDNSSLRFISSHALMNSGLSSFHFSKNLVNIGSSVFMGSILESFTMHQENPVFTTDGISIYKNNGSFLVTTVQNIKAVYQINDSVTSLSNHCFRGCRFSQIVFPSHHISLSVFCFGSCYFDSIILPENTTSIPGSCFDSSKLKTIVIPGKVKSIEYNAFASCKLLASITLPFSLITISDSVFSYCTSLRYIEIPYNVVNFGNGVFTNCHSSLVVNFTNKERFTIEQGMVFNDQTKIVEYFGQIANATLTIPSNIKTIGIELFQNADLYTVIFDNPSEITFGASSFRGSTIQTITLPNSLTVIGKQCFQDCKKLRTIIFSGTTSVIPESCFYGCIELTSFEFQSTSITKIERYAFCNTKKLKTFNFGFNPLVSIYEGAFMMSGIETAAFPDTLKFLDIIVFSSSSLQTFSAPKFLQILQKNTFEYCSLLSHVSLNESVEQIEQYCFQKCTRLTNITLSPATKIISLYSFCDCSSLCFVTIPKHSNLSRIFPFAFKGCIKFSSFQIEDRTKFSFDEGALMNGIKTQIIFFIPISHSKLFVVPGTIESISDYAFQSCTNLVEVIIPDGVITSIGYKSFEDCISLQRIILPKSLITISEDAFKGCIKLRCGSIVMNEQLIDQAIKSGIRPHVVLPECLESNDFLHYGRQTCKRATSYFSQFSMIFITPFIFNK